MPDNTWTIEKFAKLLKTLENISDEELIARQKNLKSLMHWSRQMWGRSQRRNASSRAG